MIFITLYILLFEDSSWIKKKQHSLFRYSNTGMHRIHAAGKSNLKKIKANKDQIATNTDGIQNNFNLIENMGPVNEDSELMFWYLCIKSLHCSESSFEYSNQLKVSDINFQGMGFSNLPFCWILSNSVLYIFIAVFSWYLLIKEVGSTRKNFASSPKFSDLNSLSQFNPNTTGKTLLLKFNRNKNAL